MSPPNAVPTNAPAHVEPATAVSDLPICLDFLKGRCLRTRCRFNHPDLSEYQQLSGAVLTQAGRHVCEVWAMTGTCKFGAKCSRLHPSVVVNPPTQQPGVTLLLPMATLRPPAPATPPTEVAVAPGPLASEARPSPPRLPALPFLPLEDMLLLNSSSFRAITPPPQSPPRRGAPLGRASPPVGAPGGSPLRHPGPQRPAPSPPPAPAVAVGGHRRPTPPPAAPVGLGAAPRAVRRPEHVALPDPPREAVGAQPALPDLVRSILEALEAGPREPRVVAPIGKEPQQVDPTPDRGLSLACLFSTVAPCEQSTSPPPYSSPPAFLTAPTPAPQPVPSAVKAPKRRNPQHERDRAFLDMLRDLHNAGRR